MNLFKCILVHLRGWLKRSYNDEIDVPSTGEDSASSTGGRVKVFYPTQPKGPGRGIVWVEDPQLQNVKLSEPDDTPLIAVYMSTDSDRRETPGQPSFKHHILEIWSRSLIRTLIPILNSQDYHLSPSTNAMFEYPFSPLFFSFDQIKDRFKELDTEPDKQDRDVLLKVLHQILSPIQKEVENLRSAGLISFRTAWAFFSKNSLVYSPGEHCGRLFKVVGTRDVKNAEAPRSLAIACTEIVLDGNSFVWRDIQLDIPLFQGNKPINKLPHYPVTCHGDWQSVIQELAATGKRVLKYQGSVTHCEYKGLSFDATLGRSSHEVRGRILVDIEGYIEHNNLPVPAPPSHPISVDMKYLTDDNEKDGKEYLAVISPLLLGYDLENRCWSKFLVNNISSVEYNGHALSHLVFDEGKKSDVLALVKNHLNTKSEIDDVITGKGQGLVILLSGPSGTGKTLLAEAVADQAHRPLLHLQAETLGGYLKSFGDALKESFKLATQWRAVILLDEADVYMAKRGPADIARNEAIRVFLRELEYFQGIIFLTTNLGDTIDPAFLSRINVHFVFPPLNKQSREQVWQNFLDRLPSECLKINNGDIGEVAKSELNGRQIRNVVGTAKSLADHKGHQITLKELQNAMMLNAPELEETKSVL